MDFRQLSYFLAILDYPSMSKAAEALHISQPALSSTIKSLEKELGFSLFEHSGNHLAVNENEASILQAGLAKHWKLSMMPKRLFQKV